MFAIAAAFALTACDRGQGKAKVSIQLPTEAQVAKLKKSNSNSAKLSVSSKSGGGSFGQINPTQISEYNCYALFVGGPTTELSSRACTKGFGDHFDKFTFGRMLGFAKLGTSFETELEAGPGIRFYMLGVHSSTGVCPELKDDVKDMDTSYLSNPLLLGQAKVDLVPGTLVLDMPVSIGDDLNKQMVKNCSFMGTGSAPTELEVNGAISTYNNGNSRVGYGTCSRMRIRPRVEDGDLLLEEDVPLSLQASATSGSPGQFYSDSSCTTPTTSAILVRGEETVDAFFKAGAAAATGNIIISGVFSGTSISSQIPLEVTAGGTATRFRFFESNLSLASGSCVELNYFAQDYQNVSVTPPAASIIATRLDGNPLIGVTQEFRSSCNGASLGTETTAGVDSIHFYLGTQTKDVMLTLNGDEYAYVNIQPTAARLQVAGNSTPYASECTAININAQNDAGAAADMSGLDFHGLVKRVRGFLNSMSSSVQRYDNQWCYPSAGNTHKFQILGPSSTATQYVKFSTPDPVTFNAWGSHFLSQEQTSAFFEVTPRWDPGLFAGGDKFFAKVSLNNHVMTNNEAAMASSSWAGGGGAGMIRIPAGLGSEDITEIPASSGFGLNSFPANVDHFSYGMLVKFSAVTDSTPGSPFISTTVNGSFASALTFSSGQLVLTDKVNSTVTSVSNPVSANQWYSLVVIRSPSAATCKFYLNGVSSTSIACNAVAPFTAYGIYSIPSGSMFMAEHFFMTRALSATEVSTYHNYLKNRYPAALLP